MCKVSVKFKNVKKDFNIKNLNTIIFALPGAYRANITQEYLDNKLFNGGTVEFEFKSQKMSEKFSKHLFEIAGNIFDINIDYP